MRRCRNAARSAGVIAGTSPSANRLSAWPSRKRPSPSADAISAARASSVTGRAWPVWVSARASRSASAASSSRRTINTRARDKMAAFSSKLGFSVVAPTSVMVPSSIGPRKPSCWARLKRWISSTNNRVRWPARAASRASANNFFRSATPANTAEMATKRIPQAAASRRAMVVLPVPGGPQKIRLERLPAATMRVMAPSGPVR